MGNHLVEAIIAMRNHMMEVIITTSAIMIGSIREALRTHIAGGTTTTPTHTRTTITATPGIIQRTHTRTTITRHQRSIQPITTITTHGGQPMSMDGVAQPITIPIVGLGTLTTLELGGESVRRSYCRNGVFFRLTFPPELPPAFFFASSSEGGKALGSFSESWLKWPQLFDLA
jgi:hypothetical protein